MPAATGDSTTTLMTTTSSTPPPPPEVLNPAYTVTEDPVGILRKPANGSLTGTMEELPPPPPMLNGAVMLPPLTMEEFKSLEELDADWLTWDETPIDVKKFYQSYELPQVVKVDDGDYSNFGMGTHVDVQRPFLLFTSRRCSKVLVANIYWDDSKQQYLEVGPRVVIPVNYPGWFYFLQDSGKVGEPLKSVQEVVKLKPKAFLVRSTVPCFRRAPTRLAKKNKKNPADRPEKAQSEAAKKAADGMRVYVHDELTEGELLNFSSIQSERVEQTRPACCLCWVFGKKTSTYVSEEQYLRCTDLDGQEVLLDLKLEGKFSPVGEPGTQSEDCVYQLGDVVRTVDLPAHVKLCWGQPPSSPCSFTGLLRLEDVYLEETVIACTLGANRHLMVEFPTDSEIKFIMANDAYRYFDHPVIQKAMKQCEEQIDGYVNSIKVVQSFYPEHVKVKGSSSDGVKDDGKRSLPPLPGQRGLESSQDESLDTTDDFTTDDDSDDDEDEDDDDDEDSDFSNDSNNRGEPNNNKHTLEPKTKRSGHVTINADPEIIYDDHYDEIPGDRPKTQRPPPPPVPVPPDLSMVQPESLIVPPPPPMFAEEATDSLQPLAPQANYSKVKLQRVTRHPETVPTSDDIIAPPQRWSDIDTDVKLTKITTSSVSNGHAPLRVSVSDTVKKLNTARIPNSHPTEKTSALPTNRIAQITSINKPPSNVANGANDLGQELRTRLDAFLTDSLQELDRLQGNNKGEVNNTARKAPMSNTSADHQLKSAHAPLVAPKPRSGVQANPQALQSHEDVNAYLNSIFDADSMTAEEAQTNPRTTGTFKMRSGTLPHVRVSSRPVSAVGAVGAQKSVDDSCTRPGKVQYRVAHPEATLRCHNVKSLNIVVPTPSAAVTGSGPGVRRPDHLPVQQPHQPRSPQSAPVVPRRTTPTLHTYSNGHHVISSPAAETNARRENIFIPIRRPESTSPPHALLHEHSNSSGEYPPSPERELAPANRADSGIVVSPRLMNDFHLDLDSPYRAPSEDPTWLPPDDLSPLSVTDVAHCLKYIGMKDKAVFRFVEEQIDGKLLLELDAALLKEGFPELNALERKKVLDFVGGWRPKKL